MYAPHLCIVMVINHNDSNKDSYDDDDHCKSSLKLHWNWRWHADRQIAPQSTYSRESQIFLSILQITVEPERSVMGSAKACVGVLLSIWEQMSRSKSLPTQVDMSTNIWHINRWYLRNLKEDLVQRQFVNVMKSFGFSFYAPYSVFAVATSVHGDANSTQERV